MTYVQESKTNRLSLSLRDLGIAENTSYGLNSNRYDHDLMMSLVMFTPTKQSHLGKKFAGYSKLNNSTLYKFLKTVFSGLGVKSV